MPAFCVAGGHRCLHQAPELWYLSLCDNKSRPESHSTQSHNIFFHSACRFNNDIYMNASTRFDPEGDKSNERAWRLIPIRKFKKSSKLTPCFNICWVHECWWGDGEDAKQNDVLSYTLGQKLTDLLVEGQLLALFSPLFSSKYWMEQHLPMGIQVFLFWNRWDLVFRICHWLWTEACLQAEDNWHWTVVFWLSLGFIRTSEGIWFYLCRAICVFLIAFGQRVPCVFSLSCLPPPDLSPALPLLSLLFRSESMHSCLTATWPRFGMQIHRRR